jgi:hypothetical protein
MFERRMENEKGSGNKEDANCRAEDVISQKE